MHFSDKGHKKRNGQPALRPSPVSLLLLYILYEIEQYKTVKCFVLHIKAIFRVQNLAHNAEV